jgi:hypothetical protein
MPEMKLELDAIWFFGLVEYANVHRLGGLNTIDIKNFVAVILLESKASDDYLLVEAIMWS